MNLTLLSFYTVRLSLRQRVTNVFLSGRRNAISSRVEEHSFQNLVLPHCE